MSLSRNSSLSFCFLSLSLAIATAVLSGCGSSALSAGMSDPAAVTLPEIGGSAFGGQQPVVGGTIQFYAAGTNGYGSAGRPLVGCTGAPDPDGVPTAPCTGIVTNSAGYFTLTEGIVCPPNAYLYVMATGGNPGGPAAATNNNALALMTGLGACSGVTPQTFVQVNEVTTAATVVALQQFMSATYGTSLAESVGAPGSNLTGLANAFAAIPQLVNTVTGSAISTSSTTSNVNGTAVTLYWQAQSAKLNTLGNILSACVNTNDTAAGSSTPETISDICTSLFASVQPSTQTNAPADTIQAMLDLALNPNNTAGPFTFATANPPFASALSGAPNDWLLTLSYYTSSATKFPAGTGTSAPFLGDPYDLAVDSSGNLWVMNIYGTGSVSEIGPGGLPLAQVLNNVTNTPRSVAIDTNNNIWVANLAATTAPGAIEYVASGGTVNTYNFPGSTYSNTYGLTIDASNNVFLSPQSGGSLMEVPAGTASGSAMTAFSFPFTHSSTNIAVDTNYNLWLPYSDGLEELAATCSGTPVSCTYSSANTKTYTGGGNGQALFSSFGVVIDGSGDPWADGTLSSSKAGSANTATRITPGNTTSGVSAAANAGGLSIPQYLVVDGGNNVWISNNGAPGSSTAGSSYQVTELSNSATAISGANGYWVNMTSAGTALNDVPRGLAIDGSGNVWVSNAIGAPNVNGTFFSVSEIVGAAVPAVTPIALALKNNAVGKRP